MKRAAMTFINTLQEIESSLTSGIQNQFPGLPPSSSLGKDVLPLGSSPAGRRT